ncbi:hypothetical protein CRG98_000991 [Punica granatum]|uniref:Uncharacterized protein n=1 Tax=Punica granatum TaxID=22663 RepID=A0A2I0LD64_PUNGR|nr:hypothetical protein CRG98_000991 [Punica granatum]
MDIPCNLVPHSDSRIREPLRPAMAQPEERDPNRTPLLPQALLSLVCLELYPLKSSTWTVGRVLTVERGTQRRTMVTKGKTPVAEEEKGPETRGILLIEAKEKEVLETLISIFGEEVSGKEDTGK